MKIIEIDKILPYIKHSFPIGMGMTAICFKNKNNRVIKIYKNNDDANLLLSKPDFLNKLINLGSLSNDTYVGPDTILVKNGKVAGYMYDYVDAPILAKLAKDTKISELFKNYDLLIKDTKLITDSHAKIVDLRRANILFDGKYNIIDLDWFSFNDAVSLSDNMSKIFCCIIGQIYNTPPDYLYIFDNMDVDLFFKSIDVCDMNTIYELIRYVSNLCGESDPTLQQVKNKVKAKNVFNSYHKPL